MIHIIFYYLHKLIYYIIVYYYTIYYIIILYYYIICYTSVDPKNYYDMPKMQNILFFPWLFCLKLVRAVFCTFCCLHR